MCEKSGTCAWFTFLFLLGVLQYSEAHGILGLSEGDRCPDIEGVPQSICKKYNNCHTLNDYENLWENIAVCGIDQPYSQEIICCPDEITDIQMTPLPLPELSYDYLASLGYYKPVTYDSIIYSCTAIILSSTKVLASGICVRQAQPQQPFTVLLGVRDPREYFDPDLSVEISNTKLMKDLMLYEMDMPTDSNYLPINITSATICNQKDLNGAAQLHAIGFSQREGNNCGLFRQQLRLQSLQDCRNVQNKRNVQDIHTPNTHLCVAPVSGYSPVGGSSGCLNCLTASSSVLHVERTDGSFCVAGIATPTTDECLENDNPLYYSHIIDVSKEI